MKVDSSKCAVAQFVINKRFCFFGFFVVVVVAFVVVDAGTLKAVCSSEAPNKDERGAALPHILMR